MASWAAPGVTTVGAISGTNTNGAIITGSTLNLTPADATNGGVVTAVAQTFAGAKTFSSDIVVSGLTIGKGKADTNAIRDKNTVVGTNSLSINTTGFSNTGVGTNALAANTTGSENAALGWGALKANSTGSGNLAFGQNTLGGNTTGAGNTAVGSAALEASNGNANTAVGGFALRSNQTGYNNTAVGYNAMNNDGGTFTSGYNNTAIGSSTNITSGKFNSTAIGNGARVTADNTIQLGNTAVTDVNTSGKITAAGAVFTKAATNSTAFNASAGTTIDFSNSNLAYTTANPGAFTLTNLKDGGTYTLAVRGTSSGTASFTASGFTFVSLGNFSTIAGKKTVYTFVVMGTEVYFSMVSEQ